MNNHPYLTSYSKITLRWITELNTQIKTTKLLKGNRERNFS